MGNTDSALQGMSTANQVMDSLPLFGGVFKMTDAATGAGSSIFGGLGSTFGSPNNLLLIGGGVVLIMLLK